MPACYPLQGGPVRPPPGAGAGPAWDKLAYDISKHAHLAALSDDESSRAMPYVGISRAFWAATKHHPLARRHGAGRPGMPQAQQQHTCAPDARLVYQTMSSDAEDRSASISHLTIRFEIFVHTTLYNCM